MGVRLFVGGDAQNIQRRRYNLTGDRCFSASYGPGSRFTPEEAACVTGLLDSGAFSDAPEERLDPGAAMERQFAWERSALRWWKFPWTAWGLVSYDLLIDEKWTGRKRKKERWSVSEATRAVEVTVRAAEFLSACRSVLGARKLVLACQGVDAAQYAECVSGVLQFARRGDVLGLGGWCILGRHTTWIPVFRQTMRKVLPMVEAAGLDHVHIFGVMHRPVLGGLLWLADRHGIAVSTDSSGPALSVTWKNQRKAGAVKPTWEENTAYHRDDLASLRSSVHYTEPPEREISRQLVMFAS